MVQEHNFDNKSVGGIEKIITKYLESEHKETFKHLKDTGTLESTVHEKAVTSFEAINTYAKNLISTEKDNAGQDMSEETAYRMAWETLSQDLIYSL